MDFLDRFVDSIKCLRLTEAKAGRRLLHIYTDASLSPGEFYIGGVIMAADGARYFTLKVEQVPKWIRSRMHIGILEAI